MDNNYISLLNLTYEIEGLLMLHINRGEEASPEMKELLKRKVKSLAASFSKENDNDLYAAETAKENEMIAASVELEETEDAEPTDEPSSKTTKTTEESEPTRLEDKLSRERAKDIFKAFTLNDKFRFRRELFRDSQDDFDDTLEVISQMNDFAEAEEYFYNDLCWDPDNEVVKEFMDTVRKHF